MERRVINMLKLLMSVIFGGLIIMFLFMIISLVYYQFKLIFCLIADFFYMTFKCEAKYFDYYGWTIRRKR